MSAKITDARKDQLTLLERRIEELIKKLGEEEKALGELERSMDERTKHSVSSSAKAAKARRGKSGPDFSHSDVVEMKKIAISRLKEDLERAQKERKDLETLMDPSK